jgi:hypothetical protein
MAKKSKKTADKSKEIKTIVGNVGGCTSHDSKSSDDYFYFLRVAVDDPQGTKWYGARLYGNARCLVEGKIYDYNIKGFVDMADRLERGDLVQVTGEYEQAVWDSDNFGKRPAHILTCRNLSDLVKLERQRRPKTHRRKGI